MDPISPASLALTALGIPHEVFRHAGRVRSLEQAATERHQRPEQVVRSILFRIGESSFIMVLAAGPGQISWKRLRKHVGQSRLTMASAAEVLEVTGYRIGTVSPFGLPRSIRILIDARVMREQDISVGAGLPNAGLILTTTELRRALPASEVVELQENT